MTALNKIRTDKVGMISSLLCLVHCLTVPLVLGIWYGSKINTDHIHDHNLFMIIIDYTFLAIAVYASIKSIISNSTMVIRSILIAGLILFSAGILAKGYNITDLFLHAGSFLLIIGHLSSYINIRKSILAVNH